MNIFKPLIWTFLFLLFLVSCGGRQTYNNTAKKTKTPKSLQDGKLKIKSYSRSGDLIEELYQELIDKNPALKKLEDDIDAYRPEVYELDEKFEEYDSKSHSYYSSANYKATAITDSLLKNRILALIKSSNNKYLTKTAELNSLLKQISNNGATLDDHYSVLKIVLTLPIIEKYQDDNKPNKKEFINLLNQQEKLILKTDSLIPKY